MDTKDYFLVAGPLIGVVIGGTLTSFSKVLELRNSKRQRDREIALAKLEKLHLALFDVVHSLRSFIIFCVTLQSKADDRAVKLDQQTARFAEVYVKINEVSSLMRLYSLESYDLWLACTREATLCGQLAVDCVIENKAYSEFDGKQTLIGNLGMQVVRAVESKIECYKLISFPAPQTLADKVAAWTNKKLGISSPTHYLEKTQEDRSADI